MTAEQLSVKIKLDISDLKKGIQDVKKNLGSMNNEIKKSLPAIGSEGKKAKKSLEEIEEASDDVKDSLRKIGNEADQSLSKVSSIAAKVRQALSGAGSGSGIKIIDGQGTAEGAEDVQASLEGMQNTMSLILGMNFFELMTDKWDGIRDHAKKAVSSMVDGFKKMKKAASDAKDDFDLVGKIDKQSLKYYLQDLKGIGGAFKAAGAAAAAAVGPILAVGTAIAGVAAVISSMGVSKLGDEIYNSAIKAGMSSASYQKWAFMLERTGTQAEELHEIVKTLTEAQVDVINGDDDMINAFKQLGISASEVTSMNQEQLFERTVMALQNMENMTQRNAVAFRVFGEDATKLTQIFNMNAEDAARLNSVYAQLGGGMSHNLIQLSAQAQDAMHNLRTAFMGIRNTLAEVLLPAITWVVTKLTQLLAIINMFLKTIFGLEITSSSGSKGGLSGGFIGGSKAADSYADSVDTATKAVGKLRRSLMGFDELNVLQDLNSGGSTGSAGGAGGAGGDISIPDYGVGVGATDPLIPIESLGLDKMQAWFEKYKTLIQDITTWSLIGIGVIGCILCLMGGNWLGAIGFAAMAGIGFSVGNVEGGTFDRLSANIKTWWKDLKNWFNTNVKPIFTKAYWSEKWENIKSAASDGMDRIHNSMIGQGWDKIKNWFNSTVKPVFTKKYWSEKWDNIVNSFKERLELTKAVAASVWNGLSGWFKSNVAPKFTKTYWSEKWEAIKSSASEKLTATKAIITQKWDETKNWFNTSVAPKFTKTYWSNKFDTMRSAMSDKLNAIKTDMGNKWTSIKSWFNSSVAPKFTKTYWSNKFDTIKSAASDKVGSAVTVIKDKWTSLKSWFNGSVAPKFTTSYWTNKFSSIKSGAAAAFNGVISVVEKAVNGIIGKINTLSWKIPSWVPKYGGSSFGFNLKTISIPRLATGGIATSSTLANIGERGAEAVLPLTGSQSNAWMDMLASKIADRSGGSTPTQIVLNLDGRQLGWATIENINKITKASGELQLVLG